MSLVSINGIGKDFGIKPLFSNLTFVINENERVAVIGQNGCGKSTLLKMIAREEDPDTGEIIHRRGIHIGYVRQIDRFEKHDTPLSVLTAAGAAHNLADFKARRMLSEAGFSDPDIDVHQLSGGWKKRLSILAGLCSEPELLLLDEPTNHLDIPGILWLEDQLNQFPGSVFFVSHDRYFVERVAQRTIELDARLPGGFVAGAGGYSALIEKREEVLSNLKSQKASLSNKVRREVDWLRAGVKARTTKSKSRSDEAHRLIEELNKMQFETQASDLGFAATGRKTKELIKLDETSGGYESKVLWNNLSLTIYPGTRVGIVGANGSGKTTLLKTITGELPALKGKVLRASNLKINFFGQMREGLVADKTVKEILAPHGDSVVFQNREIHVVTWARRFLFRNDQLDSHVSELSGGEQARLLLAKISLLESDVLIFDEPTNDLDIQTLEILEQSFVEYPGAIVIVSHDRYLMARVCTDIIGFLPRNKVIRCADYGQFEIEWDDAKGNSFSKSSNEPSDGAPTGKGSDTNDGDEGGGTLSFQEKKELQSLERKIKTADKRQTELKEKLNNPDIAANAAKLIELQTEIDSHADTLESMIARWMELSERA